MKFISVFAGGAVVCSNTLDPFNVSRNMNIHPLTR